MARSLPLEAITEASFAPFGTVVDWSAELEASGRPFHILVRSEEPTGWRLAVARWTMRAARRIEYHPDSEELYAPLSGTTVLVVADPGEAPEGRLRAFLLDRPVCLRRGVWHATLTLSEAAVRLIAENLEVAGVGVDLSEPVTASLG